MTTLPLTVVVAIIRGWTRCYTWRASEPAVTERRREIDSDLWESLHDRANDSAGAVARALLRRLVAGLADDVAWRLEQLDGESAFRMRRVVAVAASMVLVAATVALPARLARGRVDLETCAGSAPTVESTADYRLQVMTCAGAFFRPRD